MQRHIVRAIVSRTGSRPTVRFIPLEIFELWKSHMKFAYGYEVADEQTGVWNPAGPAAPEQDIDCGDPVVEVIIITGRVRGVPARVERFFPESELTAILPKFLAHYGLDSSRPEHMASVRILQGILKLPDRSLRATATGPLTPGCGG